jgi:hypothetical protein
MTSLVTVVAPDEKEKADFVNQNPVYSSLNTCS